MSKLTPLEKLDQIKAKVREETGGIARVSLTDVDLAWQVRRWVPLNHEETKVIAQEPSPEGAINAAHKRFFPPIPSCIAEVWNWNRYHETWSAVQSYSECGIFAWKDVQHGVKVYRFTRGSRSEAPADVSGYLLDAFKEVRCINLDLGPPTEE